MAWEALLGRIDVKALLASGPPEAQALLLGHPPEALPDLWYAAFREAGDPEPVGLGLATKLEDARRESERSIRELGERSGGSHVLPERLSVNDDRMAGWFSTLEARGVRVEVRDDPLEAHRLDLLVRGMLLRQFLGQDEPDDAEDQVPTAEPMTGGHGVRDDDARAFHAAAATFAEAAPWRWFPRDAFVEVVEPRPPKGMKLFSVHRDADGSVALNFVSSASQAKALSEEQDDARLLGFLNDGLSAVDFTSLDEALAVEREEHARLNAPNAGAGDAESLATLIQLQPDGIARASRQRLRFVTALLHALALQTEGVVRTPEGTQVPLEVENVPGGKGGRFQVQPRQIG